jgi:Tfp pilus assembly protein PilF
VTDRDNKTERGRRGRKVRERLVRAAVVVLTFLICLVSLAGCSDKLDAARDLENQGDVEGALEVYAQILKEDPQNLEALNGTVYWLLMSKRYDEALPLQERLAQLEPEKVDIRIELGFNYLNHQSRPADAVKAFGDAVRLDPSAKNRCFLAQAQEAAGDPPGAEQVLKQAIAAQPDYAYSYQLLAGLLQRQGRNQEAADLIKSAASLGIDVTKTS